MGGLLGSRDAVAVVDDEEGHTLDAVRDRLRHVGLDLGQVGVLGESGRRRVTVETHLGGQVGEVVGAADVATLGEIGAQQALLQLELRAVSLREVQ